MDKNEFMDFFNKNRGHLISGIHNYCDRWCERCNFTSKCSVYAMEEHRKKERGSSNEDFMETVSENFKIIGEMLKGMAEEKGFDLDTIDYKGIEKEEEQLKEYAKSHPLSVKSDEYAKLARQWFEDNKSTLENLEQELNEKQKLGIIDEGEIKEVNQLKDALDIIYWYLFQIHVKLMRALQHGELDLDYEDPIQNDVNGSAKMALIGTKRSLAGWGILLRHLPEEEDSILPILVLLGNVRNGILKTFPDVNKFIRPGFDE